MALRVTQAFGGHSVGDLITDAAEITAVTDSDQATFVVPVADEPAPKPAPVAPPQPAPVAAPETSKE